MSDRIYVPVVDSNEIVAIDLNQLPESSEDLLDLLVSEAAPLSTWFDCARAYLQHGRLDAFDHIYETATSEETAVEVERYFGQKPTYERIQFFTARAAILIAQFRDEKQADAKALLLSEAKKLITTASSLDPNEQLVLLTSGLHHMARVGPKGPHGGGGGLCEGFRGEIGKRGACADQLKDSVCVRVCVCGGGGGGVGGGGQTAARHIRSSRVRACAATVV